LHVSLKKPLKEPRFEISKKKTPLETYSRTVHCRQTGRFDLPCRGRHIVSIFFVCSFVILLIKVHENERSFATKDCISARHKLSSADRRAFTVAAPSSVWNSLAGYLRDLALGLDGFKRQLETFLFTL